MIQRKTQTPEYWQSFALSPSDVEFLRTLLLDAERPLTTRELARSLVAERVRREESEMRAELSKGTIYQPKKQFAVGDKVLFPQLDYRLGEVMELRAGENPEYGQFEVITVEFGAGKRQRSFAANLQASHKLNADTPDALQAGPAVDLDAILNGMAKGVPEQLREALAKEDAFATVEDRWMPRDLLAEVHVGHLNIAEAIIDMNQVALNTATLQKELDLPKEIASDITAFSLESALAADDRFDQVGVGDERRWFLRRLEPVEAFAIPELLRYEPAELDEDALDPGPPAACLPTRRRVGRPDRGVRRTPCGADRHAPAHLPARGVWHTAAESACAALLPCGSGRSHDGHAGRRPLGQPLPGVG